MGHLDQERQQQYSTKVHPYSLRDLYIGIADDLEAPTIPHRPGTIYSDPTGRFLTTSSQGNNYILVVFESDSNYIFAEPMPSQSAQRILKAYEKCHQMLVSRGITPKVLVLDNEVSNLLKQYISSTGGSLQIVPPNQHRAKAAERAIRTFKNHFISTLCSCDPLFPMHLWDRLLDQAVITLNLLRTPTINHRLSAYAQLHGSFNYLATPLGPPGTKVIIHEKPKSRGTWAPHGVEGWYLGPAMDHYRSYHMYVPSTKSTRVADTLVWLPSHVVMPTASSTDIAMAAAYDLTQALLHPSPASALSPLTDSQTNALKELAAIFGTVVSTPPTAQLDLLPTLPTHDEPRVPPAEQLHSDPRVPSNGSKRLSTAEPNGPTAVPRVSLNLAPPIATVPAEPRVSLNPAPPIEPVPGAPGPNELPTVNTRVRWSDPPIITEPLSSPLTTNVPVTHPTIDLSYSRYNHNGPQRRRQQRHNRRHRNPLHLPTVSHSTSVPTVTAESHLILPTTTTTPVPNTTPIPILASDPVTTDPAMTALNHSQPIQATRRSTHGKKVVRFDPRTHRLLPIPTYHANSLTSVPSSADTFLTESSEIRLRQALKGPDASIWARAVTMELGRYQHHAVHTTLPETFRLYLILLSNSMFNQYE